MKISEYRTLLKLAKKRLNSPQDYKELEYFQGKLLFRYLDENIRNLPSFTVLDVGCGLGGYAQALKMNVTRIVGLDLTAKNDVDSIERVIANAINSPFSNDKFDLILCINLIEHVNKPEDLIKELIRLVRVGGFIYLSFPPFYSPIGGHHFSPYHLLGEKCAVRMVNMKAITINKNWVGKAYRYRANSYKNAFDTYGLYPLTIKKVKEIIDLETVKIIDQSTKLSKMNISRIPFLGEVITWNVQFLLRKN